MRDVQRRLHETPVPLRALQTFEHVSHDSVHVVHLHDGPMRLR
jgi:hypothetical protein